MEDCNILIVCDEPTTSRIWALCIAELHCHPLVAYSIEQAVHFIKRPPQS